ncbi:hypothetical protein CONLIGDRAFT_632241 [Coniochaeta ligniaria NRRL 30616]|uniref:Uncharacterized protein n=1 Tax=Coniochaeta ligniaria NRRL 30616 TaxID=1408157 RepID=A0A1J7JLG7_9PEZI|nr:hypothetical protein CONLIGDRAFT_632241 [Coniochaeta ligniaria NRRL 30616]
MDPDAPTFPRVIKFRLGRSTVSAVAEGPYESRHRHVIRLTILRGIWQRRLVAFLSKLPGSAQTFINNLWPGWFLPKAVVLKELKRDWDDEFDTEKEVHNKLKPLQGDLIPIFYGEAQCEGTRALVLSEVDGVVSYLQSHPPLPREEFKRRIEAIYQKLGVFKFSRLITFFFFGTASQPSPQSSSSHMTMQIWGIFS